MFLHFNNLYNQVDLLLPVIPEIIQVLGDSNFTEAMTTHCERKQ